MSENKAIKMCILYSRHFPLPFISHNRDWAESSSQPMKNSLFIDHIIKCSMSILSVKPRKPGSKLSLHLQIIDTLLYRTNGIKGYVRVILNVT